MKFHKNLKNIIIINLYFLGMDKSSKYFTPNRVKKIQIKYEHSSNSQHNNIKKNIVKNDNDILNHQCKTYFVNNVIKKEKYANIEEEEITHKINEANELNSIHKINQNNPSKYGRTKRKAIKSEKNDEIIKNLKNENDIKTKKKIFMLTYNKIKEMRKNINAPVDKYGCHMLSEQTDDLKIFRFQTLISCLLSSRTKDEVTAMVMDRLKKHGLNVENILKTPEEELKKLIFGVGFYNVKSKQIIKICQILKEKYNSDIPHNYEELIKLPGIGEKVSQLILQTALNKHEGIAVDIHVHRISNRLNWVYTKNELDTQIKLKSFVDKELWSELNHLLVGFGQVICKGKKPLCGKCTLTDYCQYYNDNFVKKKKKKDHSE
ncbi:endonuclease III homologue, putative [Plasmodium berghei]|uniref:Endonuclease III homolog n=2 Tax=Plasmodium berghei TaxID=5821 RepID=A0A509AM82_PLABA|nr:endonuclease III-like protein 1, putative [Plasmodium berghei ANKA]CXI79882.1 endonuclease III homologue, putative [Plasmodium berghei]SCM25344.1 endonuclease III homologue, putative [Plasmodium berghei]SCN27339.1 endonuclease III homologue, putative [Plasmodium berghei]SCO61977.1 endonuclease III homologue, putative [Plasmodium berghei]SCO63764.1 endonuclease III homologue, putative [Plasmodium berghei]|eukprot:XP_034422973.1 endonuclease III-like protein 1, putative [Plasmodium berghei ANKA]